MYIKNAFRPFKMIWFHYIGNCGYALTDPPSVSQNRSCFCLTVCVVLFFLFNVAFSFTELFMILFLPGSCSRSVGARCRGAVWWFSQRGKTRGSKDSASTVSEPYSHCSTTAYSFKQLYLVCLTWCASDQPQNYWHP